MHFAATCYSYKTSKEWSDKTKETIYKYVKNATYSSIISQIENWLLVIFFFARNNNLLIYFHLTWNRFLNVFTYSETVWNTLATISGREGVLLVSILLNLLFLLYFELVHFWYYNAFCLSLNWISYFKTVKYV